MAARTPSMLSKSIQETPSILLIKSRAQNQKNKARRDR